MLPLHMFMKLDYRHKKPRARTNPATGPGAPVSVIIDKGRDAPREIQSAGGSSVQAGFGRLRVLQRNELPPRVSK